VTIELVDTSALVLAKRNPGVGAWLTEAALRDEVAICPVIALEYLMGARTARDYAELELALDAFRALPIEPADWTQARSVHRDLARTGAGHQRSVRIPDLLIAAVAERNGLALAHYDEDYERIAAITGQPTRWVIPRGTA